MIAICANCGASVKAEKLPIGLIKHCCPYCERSDVLPEHEVILVGVEQ